MPTKDANIIMTTGINIHWVPEKQAMLNFTQITSSEYNEWDG